MINENHYLYVLYVVSHARCQPLAVLRSLSDAKRVQGKAQKFFNEAWAAHRDEAVEINLGPTPYPETPTYLEGSLIDPKLSLKELLPKYSIRYLIEKVPFDHPSV